MGAGELIAGLAGVAVILYLAYALLFPEKF
ncbi:MAG: potassium-transporting ATPase subunit F [Thermomicrobiales bacterium]|nr:potassium-transporting ATPase subunit F [Chloroflexia bacterium]